jgi:hypothetical protein
MIILFFKQNSLLTLLIKLSSYLYFKNFKVILKNNQNKSSYKSSYNYERQY